MCTCLEVLSIWSPAYKSAADQVKKHYAELNKEWESVSLSDAFPKFSMRHWNLLKQLLYHEEEEAPTPGITKSKAL